MTTTLNAEWKRTQTDPPIFTQVCGKADGTGAYLGTIAFDSKLAGWKWHLSHNGECVGSGECTELELAKYFVWTQAIYTRKLREEMARE